ncbi:MAG: TIR domain-containing protein, partial [Microcystis panniformis]
MKDVFICHASEDKLLIVEPLVSCLEKADITFWYDRAEIKWGDSITAKVNEGLR